MKGQSAIEYLTTYGWMLLVIAIVGAAIFTSVQNSAQIQSVSGLNNADVQVSDYGLNDEGLQLSLRSASADQVNIQKVTITDTETGVSADISPSQVVAVGDTTTVDLQGVQTTDISDTYQMDIVYDTGGLEGLTAEGRITGSFGVFNRISLEEAKFNRSVNELQIDVKNMGDNTTDSIGYTVGANNTDYTGNLPNLDSGEEAQINVSTDETYSLESVNIDTEGTRFVNSDSGLECTPTKELVGYWPFNEEQTQNGYAIDLSGYGNNGSLNGGLETGINGEVGEAYDFDGKDDLVDYGKKDIFSPSDSSFSIVLSINPEGGDSWSPMAKSFNTKGWRVRWDKDPFGGGSKIRWDVHNGTENLRTDFVADFGNWRHFTGQIDREDSKTKVFIDGEKVDSTSIPPGIGSLDSDGDAHLSEEGGGYFDGKLDEFRIYNRSLSQSEIQRLNSVRSEDWAVSGCKLTG